MQEKDQKQGKGTPFQDDEKDLSAGKDLFKKKRKRRPRKKNTAEDRKKEVLSDSDSKADSKVDDSLKQAEPAGLTPEPVGLTPEPVGLTPEPAISTPEPFSAPVPPVDGAADFPAFDSVNTNDSVHTNVPDENLEHRYNEGADGASEDGPTTAEKEKKPEVKEEPLSPFESADVPREPSGEPTPFSAPTTPGEPTPLESKPFEDKPLDNLGDSSAMPFEAPNVSEHEKKDMVEDSETDEQRDTQADDNIAGTSTLEEGAVQEYEQNDPLTSHPAESPVEELPEEDSLGAGAQVEVSDVTDLNADGEPIVPSDEAGFWDMLEDAGIQKKHVFMVAGVFGFILIIVLFFIFGGYSLLTGGEDKPGELADEVVVEQEIDEPTDESTNEPTIKPVPTTADQEFGLSGLVNSYIFGLEFSKYKVLPGLNLNPVTSGGSTVGVDAALSVGQPQEVSRDAIVFYVDLLRKIDNSRKLEIYNYLNQFVDRRAALQDHLAVLNGLLLQADEAKNYIIQELNRIDVEYDATGDEKDTYETTFFESMNGFNGEQAHDYLELFVGASQQRVKMKAYFNALNTLNEMFDASISALIPRIQDISLNSEALIKGVQVFEVTGSSIDAIILQQN
jgi:hypothetical protein